MDSRSKFTESKVNTAFKRVRNRLRKYDAMQIIFACISHLTKREAGDVNELLYYPPWLLLLLMKWTVLYGETGRPRYQQLSASDFNYLIRLLQDISSVVRLPSQYDNWFIFLRNMAYQQFWLQEQFTRDQLARQSLLFGHLEPSHSFRQSFASLVGVTIEDFIELSMVLLTKFLTEDETFVTENWFTTVKQSYSPETINRFVSALSLNFPSARQYLRQLARGRSVSYEFYEQSPLRRYPLLRLDDKYYCYSTSLLYHALQTFIFDILRSSDSDKFMDKFGLIFQKYVEKSLSYTGLPFIKEDDLRSHISGKAVDFLIVDDNDNILVDAKGVEIGHLGMVSHLPEVVVGKTKSSILKGIRQGFETVKQFANIEQPSRLGVGTGGNYLLIITYKDLYISNGRNFYKFIAKDELDRIVADYGGKPWIPFENMYFLSIDDLDVFVQCAKDSGQSIAQCLRNAVLADSNPKTSKFIFRQHVFGVCPKVGVPHYLEEEFNLLFTKIFNKVA